MIAPVTPPIDDRNLWRALADLHRLLQEQCNVEATYQKFFEHHSVVFRVMGFDRYASFERTSGNTLPHDMERGYAPAPDFLCANSDTGELTVFELKTPFVGEITTARPDGNRLKFKASAESYLSQTTEYVNSIRGNFEAREVVKRILDIPKISSYQIALVYGLSEELDDACIGELLDNRKIPTKLYSFDDIAERLAEVYSHGKMNDSIPGWTYVYHLAVQPSEGRKYIADCGGLLQDRVSFVREGSLLAFECLDSSGKLHRVQAQCDGGVHYVRFEFSTAADSLYMSLHIDDEQHDLRVSKIPICCSPNPAIFHVGTSLEGDRNAAFNLYETYNVGRTLAHHERLGSYVHYLDKFERGKFLE